jgi:hypothetical protein
MPISNETMLATINVFPTYDNIDSNSSELQEESPEPNIAAQIYFAMSKNAAIAQKETPAYRLFITTDYLLNN